MEMSVDEMFDQNKRNWNERVAVHIQSDFYRHSDFLAGKCSLQAPELDYLGKRVAGKKLLHLQCHFGQDTLSWARRGANVTGVDFSDKAIETAKATAETMKIEANFLCANVYELPAELDGQFNLVFTSYGVIGWLPDLKRWAAAVSRCLKPGGLFLMVEFHPAVWMLDDDFKELKYSYFNVETIVTEGEGTYADREAPIKYKEYGWNHPLADVFSALLGENLQLESFTEYDYSAYNCFPNMIEAAPNEFIFEKFGRNLPLMYRCAWRKEGK